MAGDLLDLAALGGPASRSRAHSLAASLAVAGVAALDVINGLELSTAERLEG